MPKIYAAIEAAIASGVPPQYVAANLIQQGWPASVVNEALSAWLNSHGRLQQKTGFGAWLKKYRHKALPAMLTVTTLSIISSSIALLKPWPTKIMVDSAFGSIPAPGALASYTHTPTLILITSIMTIGIFVVGSMFGILRDFVVLKLGFWLNRDIKMETLRHILHLPLYHPERLAKGDYVYRQNTLTNSLADLVLDSTATIAESVIMIFGVSVIMFLFDPKLTLISLVVIPFLYLLIRVFGPPLGTLALRLTEVASQTSSTINESVDSIETIQSFNMADKQLNKADRLWQKSYSLSRKGLLLSHFYRFSNGSLIILGTSAVMYFGGTAALNQEITLGQLLIFMTYMGYLLGPVEALANEIATRNQKKVDVSRVYEVLSDHEGIEQLRQEHHFPMPRGKIEFQHVSYSYKDQPVLKEVNLTIEPGQKIGIIGPSGGGKSTFLKLFPLFIEPSEGRILIDNTDIQTVSLKELRQNIAWISQTPQLFNESILENLTDGNVYRQMSLPEIGVAITAANVKEFTDRLPQQLATPAGEGGNALSGGQRQRVAIARGLLKNAPIICMDEPTAALDSQSENNIVSSLGSIIKGKTVILVTHRRALLALMDTIYVMDNGQLVDVNQLGGLEQYLQKIEDRETGSSSQEAASAASGDENYKQATEELAKLRAVNEHLQLEVQAADQHQNQTLDGTIFIKH